MIRVAIADDHPEMRMALRLLLSLSEDVELVCESVHGLEALECVQGLEPDVLVIDHYMPELTGLEAVKQIAALGLTTRIIMISLRGGGVRAAQAREAGALGFVPKEEVGLSLLPAIRAVYGGETFYMD